MARLPKGIFGPLYGKLGPVVGATWNGIPYVRSKPKKKRKKRTVKTEAQIANEARFKFVNRWMVPFHPYMMIGFGNFPIDKPPVSMALSLNYRQIVIGSYPDFNIDYSKVVLSVGDLPGLAQPVIAFSAPDTLELTWVQSVGVATAFDDQLMLVLYSRELELADGFIGGVKRASGKCSFQFVEQMIGKALDVYISVTSLNRKGIANSIYLGRMEP